MFELFISGQFHAGVDGTVLRGNAQLCALLGRAKSELEGKRLADFAHPDDRSTLDATWQRLLSGEAKEAPLALRLIRSDGGVLHSRGSVALVRDETGSPQILVGALNDVTPHIETEKALADSRERLRLLVDSARDYAIISMDVDRRVTSWNAGAELITGYTAAEMSGRSADVLFIPEDLDRAEAEHEAKVALVSGRSANERWHRRRDGSRFWGSGVLMAMLGTDGRPVGLVKIFRDETETRRWNEALAASRNQLWEALRDNEEARRELTAAARAKDHFLAVLSHELRTPLTPVLMATQALALRDDLPDEVRAALEMIERNVRTEAGFIDDLLELTNMATEQRVKIAQEPTDLHDAVLAAVHASEPEISEKEIQCEVELRAERHRAPGDARRLQQAVRNVLANAAKFTPRGGRIEVRSENIDDRLRLTIRDSGIGIDPDEADRIFDAFAQAGEWVAQEYGGLGLGLAIAKASIQAHGGSIGASSAGKDRGTTLTIELPLMS